MTEQEWLACTDQITMLKLLRDKASDRKLRLFVAAFCRSVWQYLTDERSQNAVRVAEKYADGEASTSDLDAAYLAAEKAADAVENARRAVGTGKADAVWAARAASARWCTVAGWASEAVRWTVTVTVATEMWEEGTLIASEGTLLHDIIGGPFLPTVLDSVVCDLIREIVGNPFRPAALDPAWRTPTVTALATAAYEDRHLPAGTLDPNRLAVLADALEDAGCTDEQLLAHLRQSSPHVRGCWVIDLLLGKE